MPTACPVCGSDRSKVLYPSTVTRTHTSSSEFYVPTYSHAGMHREISRCEACGFRFVSDRIPDDELSRAYVDMADPSYLREIVVYQKAAERILERLEPFRSEGPRLLEIGCGAGFFLEEAQRRGWDVHGIELSRWMVERASERVAGDRVLQGSYDSELFRDSSFDVVVAVDVIEHVTDPGHLLRDVAARLRPGGIVYLVTPDSGSLPARMLGERWWYVQVPHLSYFSRPSMSRLLERTGFVATWIGSYPRFVTSEVVRNRLEYLRPGPRRAAAFVLAPLLARPWTLRLDLGDQLAAVARRA